MNAFGGFVDKRWAVIIVLSSSEIPPCPAVVLPLVPIPFTFMEGCGVKLGQQVVLWATA